MWDGMFPAFHNSFLIICRLITKPQSHISDFYYGSTPLLITISVLSSYFYNNAVYPTTANTQWHMIIGVCCSYCLGHSEAGRQLCNPDWATLEASGWPAIGFSRLALSGVTGMTQLCSACLSSSSVSRPGMFSWWWQRSKGIAKSRNVPWGLGSELAIPSPYRPKQATRPALM